MAENGNAENYDREREQYLVGLQSLAHLVADKRERAPHPNDEEAIDKAVNGVREFRNESQFVRGTDGSWTAEIETPQYHLRPVITVEGDAMKGRLVTLPDQVLVRRVSLRRVGAE
ncbi:MAG TPA: hypothetical protein VLK88_15805 [Gemmatimonadales bacterium]|nr:hypothetical protein [Gemmatimonadales bacterium]